MLKWLKTHFKNIFRTSISTKDTWKLFSARISYIQIDINSDEGWNNLKEIPADRAVIYYLATPPNLYKRISSALNEFDLIKENCRVVVEKPIGTDLNTAKEINDSLATGFK